MIKIKIFKFHIFLQLFTLEAWSRERLTTGCQSCRYDPNTSVFYYLLFTGISTPDSQNPAELYMNPARDPAESYKFNFNNLWLKDEQFGTTTKLVAGKLESWK